MLLLRLSVYLCFEHGGMYGGGHGCIAAGVTFGEEVGSTAGGRAWGAMDPWAASRVGKVCGMMGWDGMMWFVFLFIFFSLWLGDLESV